MKKLLNLFLLTVMFFSVTHEVVYAEHADEHCTPHEYIAEFSTPDVHHDEHEDENDACDTHYMFHISFLVPEAFSLEEANLIERVNHTLINYNSYTYQNNTFRPPIA